MRSSSMSSGTDTIQLFQCSTDSCWVKVTFFNMLYLSKQTAPQQVSPTHYDAVLIGSRLRGRFAGCQTFILSHHPYQVWREVHMLHAGASSRSPNLETICL